MLIVLLIASCLQEHGCFRREVSEHVALTEVVLDLLPRCRGTERFADQFVLLVKECVLLLFLVLFCSPISPWIACPLIELEFHCALTRRRLKKYDRNVVTFPTLKGLMIGTKKARNGVSSPRETVILRRYSNQKLWLYSGACIVRRRGRRIWSDSTSTSDRASNSSRRHSLVIFIFY